MRRLDDSPLDPEVVASLDAIDATLAGEPVDPRHAELAELALLLASERPEVSATFAASLDKAVERRFAAAGESGASSAPHRWWLWTPAAGLAVAIVVAIVVGASTGPTPPRTAASSAKPSSRNSASSAGPTDRATSLAPSQGSTPALQGSVPTPAIARGLPVQPAPNGRKIVQGAQLALTTAPARIDTVAQEVFTVVGQNDGIVKSSTVTADAGTSGYALFQLSIPSSALPETMASLSSLRFVRVASRTDTSQDVNDQYQAAVRRLADARALRSSLLKQLATATTQTQIESLKAQIHDAEASISSDEAALRALNSQINYSHVTVSINGGPLPVPSTSGGGGFSLRQAAHDAGRVLTVAAGVALIAGAVLVPFALLAALGWWIRVTVRRRRREQALDLV